MESIVFVAGVLVVMTLALRLGLNHASPPQEGAQRGRHRRPSAAGRANDLRKPNAPAVDKEVRE